MKHDVWVALREPINNGRNKARSQYRAASDPQFSGSRIGQKYDILDALTELIEHGGAALRQGGAIDGRLGTVTVAFKQTHAEDVLKVRDCLRYDRPRNGKSLRCKRQTLVLHDRQENMEVVQSDTTTDAFRPIHQTSRFGS